MSQELVYDHFHQFKPVDKLVYLVTQDQQFATSLSHQISHFGYFLQVIRDLRGLEHAIAEHISVAVVVDISPFFSGSEGEKHLQEFSESWQGNIPLLFVSDQDGQEMRLTAIRARGSAFFAKPIDIVDLVDKLDSLQVAAKPERQRVLIVEDQLPIANYYQMVLNLAGMDADLVTDPNHFLQKVVDFHPGLILMDLYMPVVNGFELAKMLRQMDEFVSIPIVFLSSEDDFDRRMEAMHLGGDDFLSKPIKAAHLVGLVKSRLERLHTLRFYMVRDSLTGLINHTTFRGMLAQEVSRCRREQRVLSLAMIDLDNFKKVNDTYGHSIGDSVLKSLSRLLKQRLRASDIIGRYGGEEFVVLLHDADANQAFMVMDEIRNHFAEIEHHSVQKGVIYVTLSCGVASFPEFPTAKNLSDAADKAMYAAKAAGRNQVIIAKS